MNAELERLRLEVFRWRQWCQRFGYALLGSAALWVISTGYFIAALMCWTPRPRAVVGLYTPADIALLCCTTIVVMCGTYATVRGTRANRLFHAAQHEWFDSQVRARLRLFDLLEGPMPPNYVSDPDLFEKDLSFALLLDMRGRAAAEGVEAAWQALAGLALSASVTSPLSKVYRSVLALDALFDFVGRCRPDDTLANIVVHVYADPKVGS